MAENTPTRKSGRKRVRNQKYTDDLFVKLNLEVSDGDDRTPSRRRGEGAKHDGDFNVDQVSDEPELSAEGELSAAEASEDSAVANPDDSEGDEMPDVQVSGYEDRPKKKHQWKPPPEVHSKGISDKNIDISHGSEKSFLRRVWGTAKEDVTYYRRGRDKWANNISLPSKQPDFRGWGGMSHPFNHTAKQREMEATVGWDWYYVEGGKASFEKKQTIRALSADEGAQYVPKPAESSHSVLMGPYGKQKLFSITFMQSLNIDDAWSQAGTANLTNSGFTPVQKTPSKRQDGWVLNVGSSVLCLDWAPNHPDKQYLAISPLPSNDPLHQAPPKTAPAYTSLPGPSSIQIWAVTRSSVGAEKTYQPPELRLVICTEWGHAKQLKWCPMPRVARDAEVESRVSLGLLAGVWADGSVRVLDLYLDKHGDASTKYVIYEAASFASKPAEALCSCVDWLSPTDLAVGCSNGYVAIWNIFPPEAHHSPARESSQPPEPRDLSSNMSKFERLRSSMYSSTQSLRPSPYFYTLFHPTYIHAICSAYPTHPHLIATSSASGYLRLTDIRSPASDYVLNQRTHWTPTSISYCATLSCFVTYEESGVLKLYAIRRFWSSISFAKGDSEVVSVAVGHLHPTVLAGFADGTLLAVNPMRRFVNARSKRMLQQRVWKHEWARQKRSPRPPSSGEEAMAHAQADPLQDLTTEPDAQDRDNRLKDPSKESNGEAQDGRPKVISRITEGYKTESPVLAPPKPGLGTENETKSKDVIHALYSTIYDEETAVRQVAWNPNEGWGGWAASGTGSGLLRIEDLAI